MRRVLALLPFLTAGALAAESQTFTVKTLPAQMKYDVTEMNVPPGTEVKIHFVNQDDMPHNMVFFQAGADAIGICNKQMEKPDEALKRNYLPEDPAVWMHSKVLNPKEQEDLVFTAPTKPGAYPFACSMPGHAAIMNGILRIFAPGPQLADLQFKLYLGEWTTLPDFSKLQPHREGPVPDNLVQIKLDDYKNQFGIVYTGKLKAPSSGEYYFALASDDGSRLLIDGKKVVDHDGIHPAKDIKEGKIKLDQGEHTFRLEYFQAGGEIGLYVGWRGPEFAMTPLSSWTPPNWKSGKTVKKDDNVGMPLTVEKEPIIYRNFIEGGDDRSIGVGYPGGVNLAWSANKLNLAEFWRGAFIDAARHWRGRGGGAQAPLGYDVVKAGGFDYPPFAVLPSQSADWPKLEKDIRPAGFQWKGYSLDAKRFPTFHYEWNDLKISERYEVAAGAEPKLVRTLTLTGPIPPGALFCAASGDKLEASGNGFVLKGGNGYSVQVEGGTVAGSHVLVPARPEIKVTYSWTNPAR